MPNALRILLVLGAVIFVGTYLYVGMNRPPQKLEDSASIFLAGLERTIAATSLEKEKTEMRHSVDMIRLLHRSEVEGLERNYSVLATAGGILVAIAILVAAAGKKGLTSR